LGPNEGGNPRLDISAHPEIFFEENILFFQAGPNSAHVARLDPAG